MQIFRFITRKNIPSLILWLLIIGFSVYFIFVAISRHDNFHSRRLDLGNMEQTVWNIAHGNGFTLTDPMGTENISRLAVHADYLLYFMVPFYKLWEDPRILIIVQTIVICLGALPIYWIAADRLKNKYVALIFAAAYLLYPSVQRMMLHDFHAVALSMTLLLFAYWYMHGGRYGLFILFAAFAGLGKETVWIAVSLMGVYIAVFQQKKIIGVAVAGIAGFTFYYLFWHAIPGVTAGEQHFALQYLSEFGDSQTNVILNILSRPFAVLGEFVKLDRLYYYYQLLLPLGFLPLFSPFYMLFAAHSVLINALSTNTHMRQIDYQYTADIIPFLFVSAIEGFRFIRVKIQQLREKKYVVIRIITVCFAGCIVLASYMWGELPLTGQDRFFYFIWELPEKNTMKRVEERIAPMYTVSVTNNIGSHFAGRKYLYNFPVNALTADYAVVHTGDQYAWPSGNEQRRVVEELLKSPSHTLIARDGEFYAFERKR